jgi:hypothetical protein
MIIKISVYDTISHIINFRHISFSKIHWVLEKLIPNLILKY